MRPWDCFQEASTSSIVEVLASQLDEKYDSSDCVFVDTPSSSVISTSALDKNNCFDDAYLDSSSPSSLFDSFGSCSS